MIVTDEMVEAGKEAFVRARGFDEGIRAALEAALSPLPEARLSREIKAQWPSGCRHPSSCHRNGRCGYLNCRWEPEPKLVEMMDAAVLALLQQKERAR